MQDVADEAGDTPLTPASRVEAEERAWLLLAAEESARLLLEAGADPDADPCFPPSAACANRKLLSAKALLEAGDNANPVHPLTGIPLMYETLRYYRGFVVLLLLNGADVNAANIYGTTALHQAASLGLVNMAQCLIIHGAKFCATGVIPPRSFQYPARFTPLADRGRLEMVKNLIGRMEEQGVADGGKDLALCAVAGSGHVDIINLLLEHRWDEKELPKGSSPLLYAIGHGYPTTIAEFFLSRGADIHATLGEEEKTALHLAASRGEVGLLRNLIRRGANLEARTNNEGETPLLAAVRPTRNCWKAVRVLLNAGANMESRKKDGQNILHLAASVGNVPLLRRALRHGLDLDSRTVRGLTPLAIAAKHGQLRSISILLRWGASIDARCKKNYTPLHVAAAQGQWKAVGLLVEKGASLDLLNSRGYSPLQEARKHGHKAAETILLLAGAAENSRSEKASSRKRPAPDSSDEADDDIRLYGN